MQMNPDGSRNFYTIDNLHVVNKKIKKMNFVSNDLLKDRKTRAMVVVEEIGTNKSKKILN